MKTKTDATPEDLAAARLALYEEPTAEREILARHLERIARIIRRDSVDGLEMAAWRLADAGGELARLMKEERNGNDLRDVQGIGYSTGMGCRIAGSW